ncbi:MAG: hypothetical protein WCF57_14595, partial [Pyrinomonadaceae bacterium]
MFAARHSESNDRAGTPPRHDRPGSKDEHSSEVNLLWRKLALNVASANDHSAADTDGGPETYFGNTPVGRSDDQAEGAADRAADALSR